MPKRSTALALALPQRPPGSAATRWLYGALRTEILEGRLRPGARLPATRDLARQYDLSRGTVVSAFAQLPSDRARGSARSFQMISCRRAHHGRCKTRVRGGYCRRTVAESSCFPRTARALSVHSARTSRRSTYSRQRCGPNSPRAGCDAPQRVCCWVRVQWGIRRCARP
jgi:DNA-binding transcriptional MocR family regulator